MSLVLVAGPFTDEKTARETANALGTSNHSIFSRYKEDAEGYVTNEKEYFVERDTEASPARVFGRTWEEIQDMQHRRR